MLFPAHFPSPTVNQWSLAMQCRFSRQPLLVAILTIGALLLSGSHRNSAAQEATKKTFAEPHWVDPNRGEPNGTKYHTFESKTIGGEVSYLIWLPPQYETESTRRFPVIYWLHGLGGNQRGGAFTFLTRASAAIGDGSLPPAIVVLVNGMVTSFYCDWADGKRPIESVIIKDLIPHVDQTYRTIAKREGRVIEGYSMGGFGAAHLGFKYPELFGAVAVDAGALILDRAIEGPNLAPIFQGAFAGDKDRFNAEHPRNLVAKNADQIRDKQQIHIGCGGEDKLLPRNKDLDTLLTRLNIDHEYIVVEGVDHDAGQYYAKLGPKAFELHRKAFEALKDQP
jgi:enterochelin esterase-like enzyme